METSLKTLLLLLVLAVSGCDFDMSYNASITDEYRVAQFDGSTVVVLYEPKSGAASEVVVGSRVGTYAIFESYLLGKNEYSERSSFEKTAPEDCGYFMINMVDHTVEKGLSETRFKDLIDSLGVSEQLNWIEI